MDFALPFKVRTLACWRLEPVRALLEFARMQLTDESRQSAGDGHAVVLFPGSGADDHLMEPLARRCQQLGYHV